MNLLSENLERQVAAQVRKGLVVLAHRGSFLELLIAFENYQEGPDSEPLLLHVPGYTDATIRNPPLLEACINKFVITRRLLTHA